MNSDWMDINMDSSRPFDEDEDTKKVKVKQVDNSRGNVGGNTGVNVNQKPHTQNTETNTVSHNNNVNISQTNEQPSTNNGMNRAKKARDDNPEISPNKGLDRNRRPKIDTPMDKLQTDRNFVNVGGSYRFNKKGPISRVDVPKDLINNLKTYLSKKRDSMGFSQSEFDNMTNKEIVIYALILAFSETEIRRKYKKSIEEIFPRVAYELDETINSKKMNDQYFMQNATDYLYEMNARLNTIQNNMSDRNNKSSMYMPALLQGVSWLMSHGAGTLDFNKIDRANPKSIMSAAVSADDYSDTLIEAGRSYNNRLDTMKNTKMRKVAK